MNKQNDTIIKVINYIENNLEKEIDLDRISKHVGYSKFHLNRLFTDETGDTIHKYLQKKRLSLAAEKLINTDTPISEIAYEAGYHSQQSFTLAFKQIYQYPPQAYRKINVLQSKKKPISMLIDLYSFKQNKIEVKAA